MTEFKPWPQNDGWIRLKNDAGNASVEPATTANVTFSASPDVLPPFEEAFVYDGDEPEPTQITRVTSAGAEAFRKNENGEWIDEAGNVVTFSLEEDD